MDGGKRGYGLLLTGLLTWAVSLTLAFRLGRSSASSAESATNPREPHPPVGEQVAPGDGRRVATLDRENRDLRKAVRFLRGELRKAQTQARDGGPRADFSPDGIQALWRHGARAFDIAKAGPDWLGGLEELVELAVDFAAAGEPGIDALVAAATNAAGSDEERELALTVLSVLPHPKAIATLFSYATRPGTATSQDTEENLWRQVRRLPTADVAPYVADLNGRLAQKLTERQPLAPGERRMLADLALKHDSLEAIRLLRDTLVWGNIDPVLTEAGVLHTEQARAFVQEVGETHAESRYRAKAAELLRDW